MKAMGLKWGDVLVFLLCVGVVGGGTWLLFAETSQELRIQVRAGDREWVYPIDEELDLEFQGPLGVSHVHIHGGEAWMSDSPCRDKICIHAGRISTIHGWIACLPNQVFLRVIGGDEDGEIDAISF